MTYAQLLALMARLGLSFDLPVDITDPRLSAAQLAELNAALDAEFTTRRHESTPVVADLALIRDMQAAIVGEAQARIDTAEALANLEAATPVMPVAPVVPTAEEVAAAEAQAASVASEAAIIIGQGVTVNEAVEPLVLAQVASAQPAAHREAGGTEWTTPQVGWRVASAGTDIGPMNASTDIGLIGSSISTLAASVARATADGRQMSDAVVASVPAFVSTPGVDQDGVLSVDKGAGQNTHIIREVLAAHAARSPGFDRRPVRPA